VWQHQPLLQNPHPQRGPQHLSSSDAEEMLSNEQLLLTVIALELTSCLCGWWLLQPDITPAALGTSLLCLATVPMPGSFGGHSSLGITLK